MAADVVRVVEKDDLFLFTVPAADFEWYYRATNRSRLDPTMRSLPDQDWP